MASDRERFVTLLRARHPLITCTTTDEDRVVGTIVAAAMDCGRQVHTWTMVRGMYEGVFDTDHGATPGTEQPAAALRWCWQAGANRVLLFLDLAPHLSTPLVARALRELIAHAATVGNSIVLIDSSAQLSDDIEREAVPFVGSLPDDKDIFNIMRHTIQQLKHDKPIAVDMQSEQIRAAITALRGLDRSQIRRLVADAMAEDDRFDMADVHRLGARRAQFIGRGSLLDVVPPSSTQVAGSERLKAWLELRRPAFDDPDRANIDAPRGLLLLGVPGSGKSLCARAIASWWNRPLLRLDVGTLFNQYVGESERRLREALHQAEAMAPAILWVDEIEKAFASAAAHSTDGGLSQRMFGCLLTWMQERRAPVFMVATANNLAALPPELLRKGRFDEIFFVDLPNRNVRRDIARIHLAQREVDVETIDLDAIAAATSGYTGADMEAAIVTAVLHARAAKHPVTTDDVVKALSDTKPISVLMRERIVALRSWAQERCRFADDPELE